MATTSAIAQVNVRMSRELKERGDATLAAAGSSPAKMIRQLWDRLAEGGEAYERVMRALAPARDAKAETPAIERSARLFEELGASLGLDAATFQPDLRPEREILEELDWERLQERGLA
jgi:hypothetical protein